MSLLMISMLIQKRSMTVRAVRVPLAGSRQVQRQLSTVLDVYRFFLLSTCVGVSAVNAAVAAATITSASTSMY